MGKRIIQQARGKGSPTYKSPGFRFVGQPKTRRPSVEPVTGTIMQLVNCRGHDAPLAIIEYEDGVSALLQAPEGIRVGDAVSYGDANNLSPASTLELKDIPEGTLIYNIESIPGDGGKFCRTSGASGRVVAKLDDGVLVRLPSKRQKKFKLTCRASIGLVAGGGRTEKPLLKAGKNFHIKKARNKLYPRIAACSVNALDHPFGNKRSSRKAKNKPVSRHAPPGRKVGKISAKRTGKRK